jgi:hypothetical protein
MSDLDRDLRITVRLSGAEAAKLDEFRGSASRSAFLRRLLADVEPEDVSDTLTYSQVLATLSQMALTGKVAAAIHLERALRERAGVIDDTPEWLRD